MFRAMAWKELRELGGICIAALAAYGYLVMTRMYPQLLFGDGRDSNRVPFVTCSFFAWFIMLTGAAAIAAGLRQTLGESISNTYPFLYHRPAGRRWLIGTKLFVGLAAGLVCSALPILFYGLWAATPGTHASPFEWSMTVQCWMFWLGMTLLYLGAFLTGIRPGRWFGSRLFPLGASAFVMGSLLAMDSDYGIHLWVALAIVLADACTIATILFVARTRDYS